MESAPRGSASWGPAPGSAYRGVGQIPLLATWDTTGYVQQAGGTHPTRMHSSSCLFFTRRHKVTQTLSRMCSFQRILSVFNQASFHTSVVML